jgi:acyl-CoA synthetase (AMP-forming)/AMP-acid ligase II
MNVGSMLAQCAQRAPDKVAVIFGQEKLSFNQLNLMACRFAGKLRQLGIKKDDRVAIMLPNSSSFTIAYFGILKLGAIAAPLDIRLKGEDIRGIVKDSQIRVFITSSELNLSLAPFIKGIDCLTATIITGMCVDEAEGNCIPFEEIVGDETLSTETGVEVHADDEALYLYTSGTTGRPKGVVLTFNNLRFFPETMEKLYGTSDSTVTGCILPMSHISGPILCNELVDKQCSLVIFDRLRPDTILATVEKHKVTWFHAVPPIFQALLKVPHLTKYDLSSLRFIGMMGTAIPLTLLKDFKKTFPSVSVIQGYGLTETSPFITLVPLEYEQQKMGSIGAAVPHAEIKLVDEKGEEVPCGEAGELIVKGPMVMKEYHNNPEATRDRIKNGWLYTGDLCRKDEDGFYYYLGRKDDMIIVGGLNVFPSEIESTLVSHPQVVEAAAVGVSDRERGQVIMAFVVVEPGFNLSEKELISFCKDRLAIYKVPKRIGFRDTIPKTSTGKIARRLLADTSPGPSDSARTT